MNKLVEFVINEFRDVFGIVLVLILDISRLWHFWDIVGLIPLLFLEVSLSGKRFGSILIELIPSGVGIHPSLSGSPDLGLLLLKRDILSVVEVVLHLSLQESLVSLVEVNAVTNDLSSMALWDAIGVTRVVRDLDQILVLHSLGNEVLQGNLLLAEVDTVTNNVTGMARWNVLSIILMLVSLRDLGVEV